MPLILSGHNTQVSLALVAPLLACAPFASPPNLSIGAAPKREVPGATIPYPHEHLVRAISIEAGGA